MERGEPCCSNHQPPQSIITVPSKCSEIPKMYQLHNVDSEAIVDERDCLLDIATLESTSSKIEKERQCGCINKNLNLSSEHEIKHLESGIKFMTKSTRITNEPICKKPRLANGGENSRSITLNEQALSSKPYDPGKSTFRCRFCKYFLEKHPAAKNVPLPAKTSGYFVEDYKRM